jgi:hypothetical protein
MKMLIVYDDYGSGHKRMAEIIRSLAASKNCDMTMVTSAELFKDPSIDVIVSIYNRWMRRGWILRVDILINFLIRIFVTPFIESYSSRGIFENISDIEPDIIVSTTEGVNHILGSYAQARGIKFVIFVTTLTPAFIDDVDPYAHHLVYFAESAYLLHSHHPRLAQFDVRLTDLNSHRKKLVYIARFFYEMFFYFPVFTNPYNCHIGQNGFACEVVGPLAEEKYFIDCNVQDMRRLHDINPGAQVVILSSGGIGGKMLGCMVDQIINICDRKLVIVVACGHDEETYLHLAGLATPDNISIRPLRFTDNLDQFLAIADVCVFRASAGIMIESLLSNTPVIAFGRTMTADWDVCSLIDRHGLGLVCRRESRLAITLDQVLNQLGEYRNNIARFLEIYPGDYNSRMKAIAKVLFG